MWGSWTKPDGRIVHVACDTAYGLFDAYGLGTAAQVVESFHRLGAVAHLVPAAVTEATVREAFLLTEPEHDEEIAAAIHVCEQVLDALGLGGLAPHKPQGEAIGA